METNEQTQRVAEQTGNKERNSFADMPMNAKDIAHSSRMPGKGGNIRDLLDVVPDGNGSGKQEIIVIDGRVYERVLKPEDRIYELDDIVENGKGDALAGGCLNNEETARIVAQTAERIAREMVPGIAERVIKEEIEKMKRNHGMGTDH